MADDPTDPQDPPAKDDPAPAPDLGDAGKKALEAERKARRDAEKQLREIQSRLQEIEDKDKSETDRLREKVASLEADNAKLTTESIRAEVAMAKGLTAAQAKRLAGSTREELEADADEILEMFPAQAGATPPPSDKPRPDLKGGTDPTEDSDVDIKAIVDSIPRGI